MPTDLLNQVTNLEAAQRKAGEQELREVVRDLATGGAPLPEVILSAITKAGRSTADLTAAVESLKQRLALVNTLSRAATTEAEATARRSRLQAAQDAAMRAITARDQLTNIEAPVLEALERAFTKAQDALEELISRTPDPKLTVELAWLDSQRATLQAELDDKRNPPTADRAKQIRQRLAELSYAAQAINDAIKR